MFSFLCYPDDEHAILLHAGDAGVHAGIEPRFFFVIISREKYFLSGSLLEEPAEILEFFDVGYLFIDIGLF